MIVSKGVSARPISVWRMSGVAVASIIACSVLAVGRLDSARQPIAQLSSGPSVSGSITQNKTGNRGTFVHLNQSPEIIATTNTSLRVLLSVAFDLNAAQSRLISGAPDWMDSEHFDVKAIVHGNPDMHSEGGCYNRCSQISFV